MGLPGERTISSFGKLIKEIVKYSQDIIIKNYCIKLSFSFVEVREDAEVIFVAQSFRVQVSQYSLAQKNQSLPGTSISRISL